ncbi:MAG: DAK2 domain-containing protein [Candidatus Dormibacterales bacterium]
MSDALLRACILAAADSIDAARDDLCSLDSKAGDGDHGVTMALAARGVRKQLTESPEASAAYLVTRLALATGSVGGAIGPIYASGLLAVAATLRGLDSQEGLRVEDVLSCAEAAEKAVAALGGARPGDKTILDALDPAVSSLRSSVSTGASMGGALNDAAEAASAGAAATASMTAALGRASRLGERSRGTADPGASSFALILRAMASQYFRATSNS